MQDLREIVVSSKDSNTGTHIGPTADGLKF